MLQSDSPNLDLLKRIQELGEDESIDLGQRKQFIFKYLDLFVRKIMLI